MKEQMTYVAIDADDVGESVGGAVLSDDTQKLSSISGKINAGIQIFARWAEYNGGSVISSGSDEGIFEVPVASLDSLEELKEQYQKQTGFSVSIGLGDKISDAAKALIYAKVNGKNQIVDYSPEIEEAMKQSMSGELTRPDNDSQNRLKGGVGDDTDKSDLPQDELEEGTEEEKEHTDEDEVAEEIATDHLTEDPKYYSKMKEHKKEDEAEEELEDEAEEELEDEAEEELEDEAEEEPSEEEENEEFEDLDQDGQPDKEEAHGELSESDDLDEDGDIEHEEAMASKSKQKDKYSDEDDYEDEIMEDEDENDELSQALASEMEDEQQGDEEGLADEIAAEKEGEEEPSEEEMPEEGEEEMPEEGEEEMPEEGEEPGLEDEALKQAIFESLQIFKQNKEMLNALSSQNPDLYNALITSLQAMIEMAKELGYGGYGNSLDNLGEEEINPEDYLVSEEGEEEPSEEEMPEEPSEEEESEEEPEEEKKEVKKHEDLKFFFSRMNQIMKDVDFFKNEENEDKKKEMLEKFKQRLKSKLKSKLIKKPSQSKPSKDKKNKEDLSKLKEKSKTKAKDSHSFCATSHQKMRQSGADCRSGEDKDSPLCAARKKYNCRGKNEEKGPSIEKSEKLKQFLGKKRKK